MKPIVSVVFLACWSAMIACGARPTAATSPPTASGAETGPMPGDPRTEIDRLASEIDTALAQAGVATLAPASCESMHACTADAYDVKPRVEDPSCTPATTETCTQSCTLSDSVCDNAGKICKLAAQLGGGDAYANEKCQSGNDSCKRTREKCCGCS